MVVVVVIKCWHLASLGVVVGKRVSSDPQVGLGSEVSVVREEKTIQA